MGWKDRSVVVQPAAAAAEVAGWKARSRPVEDVLPVPEEKPRSRPGLARAMAINFGQGGTKGWADEISGAAFGSDPVRVTGEKAPGNQLRNLMRDDLKASQEDYPRASFLAHVAGDLASDFAASKMGVPVSSPAYQIASGGVAGAGMSEGETAADVGIDSAIGSGAAGLANMGGRYLAGPLLARAAPVLRRAMDRIGVNQGRRALLGGADSLSSREPTSAEAVREAIDSGGILPFGTTGGTHGRLDKLAAQQGKGYSAIVEELERQGVKGPVAGEVAEELAGRGALLEPRTLDPALPREFERFAGRVMSKADSGERMALTQSEDLKRSAQNMAQYNRLGSKPLNDTRKEIASVIRQANEDAIDAAGRANPGTEIEQLAEGFVPVKQRLGNLIEARDAAERGNQRAGQRGFFGLIDHMKMAADPGGGLATGITSKLWRDRGPSTVAYASRKIGESTALADALRSAPRWMGRAGAPISNAEQEALIEWLREKK